MPTRNVPLVSGQYYHIFNRGIDRRTTFSGISDYERALTSIWFYRISTTPFSLSRFFSLKADDKKAFLKDFNRRDTRVKVICYCLMPNHFHLLLKQSKENGISSFMSDFQNSYTRYYNIAHERSGALFMNQFRAVRIETDEQMIHLSRYIHLNPHTGFIVKTLEEIETFPWSSIGEFANRKSASRRFCTVDEVVSFFKDKSEYMKFLLDQAGHQRELKRIEHLTFKE